MVSKLQLASVALTGLVAAAVPAYGQRAAVEQEAPIVISKRLAPAPDVLIRTVYIADLDLKTAAAQQEMEKRVGKAVEEMCAIAGPLPSYKGPLEKPCRDEAWASARPQMELAVHRARAGS
jgi:UrcA family protein